MKRRYGFLLFLLAMAVTLGGLMLVVRDRQSAADQAKKIVLADQAGTNVQTDILKLKAFAAGHMKVNVQFVLVGSYNRAVNAAKAAAGQTSAVYAAAQANCDKTGVDSIRQAQCVSRYLASHGGAAVQTSLPNIADYTYHFTGPAWTFNVAGFILVMGGLLAVASLVSIIHRTVTK